MNPTPQKIEENMKYLIRGQNMVQNRADTLPYIMHAQNKQIYKMYTSLRPPDVPNNLLNKAIFKQKT